MPNDSLYAASMDLGIGVDDTGVADQLAEEQKKRRKQAQMNSNNMPGGQAASDLGLLGGLNFNG